MISKNDCMALLVKLEDKGVNINTYMRKLLVSKEVPFEVLQFISQNQGIEVTNFYEMLRKKHNKSKSPLYTNIVKEVEDEEKVLTTLSSLLTQILLYSNKLEDKESFLKEVRASEVTQVLQNYFNDGEFSSCQSLLKLIKADLMVLEYINGRRELES